MQQIPFAALHNPSGERGEGVEREEEVENNECRDVTCNVSRGGINAEPKPGVNINNANYQPLMLNHEMMESKRLSPTSTLLQNGT